MSFQQQLSSLQIEFFHSTLCSEHYFSKKYLLRFFFCCVTFEAFAVLWLRSHRVWTKTHTFPSICMHLPIFNQDIIHYRLFAILKFERQARTFKYVFWCLTTRKELRQTCAVLRKLLSDSVPVCVSFHVSHLFKLRTKMTLLTENQLSALSWETNVVLVFYRKICFSTYSKSGIKPVQGSQVQYISRYLWKQITLVCVQIEIDQIQSTHDLKPVPSSIK